MGSKRLHVLKFLLLDPGKNVSSAPRTLSNGHCTSSGDSYNKLGTNIIPNDGVLSASSTP